MAINAIKGMNDILPGEVETWQFLEQKARDVFSLHGFSEIRTPVVEKTELFCRSIGETTDIVEKEMYSFTDKSDNGLTLRPEGTAPVMRAFIQNRLHTLDPVSKLYYLGPMFRYERPQKGRYRQFYQLGAEVIGVESPLVDAQVLAMLHQFFGAAGIDSVQLHINSLGCPACRPAYRQQLIDFLEERLATLCGDCQRRYQTNPLRVVDCKVPGCQTATLGAPSVLDHLCQACETHFAAVQTNMRALDIPYVVNARMVRGLDYYVRTTFEMVTDQLGSQNAVAAGGRYDGLVESLGGPPLPGIGFAIGLERLVLMKGQGQIQAKRPDIFLAALGEAASAHAFVLMAQLQRVGIYAEIDYTAKSLKSQLRRANKLKARYTLVLGDTELEQGRAELKDMDQSEARPIDLGRLIETMQQLAPTAA
ncbi:MAG: histidine--tRNA ligase [Deltaproteobacteria bacterium]|nr:histidine--tRNA ligase [Deltaproteobacteria bacterium]